MNEVPTLQMHNPMGNGAFAPPRLTVPLLADTGSHGNTLHSPPQFMSSARAGAGAGPGFLGCSCPHGLVNFPSLRTVGIHVHAKLRRGENCVVINTGRMARLPTQAHGEQVSDHIVQGRRVLSVQLAPNAAKVRVSGRRVLVIGLASLVDWAVAAAWAAAGPVFLMCGEDPQDLGLLRSPQWQIAGGGGHSSHLTGGVTA